MLPASHRLTPKRDIQKVFRYGRSISTPSFQLIALKQPHGTFRAAMIVSGKIDKRSSVRNRIKRRMRELVRYLLPQLEHGFDVVLLAKPVAKNRTYQALQQEAKAAFKKANLLS